MKIRPFNRFLCCVIIILSLFGTRPAAADTYPNRISLAISGGASKGAYEAGLIWGLIEVIHQAQKTGEWAPGGEPRPIEIASMAGTSAGGINTLLAALTWSVNPENEGGFANRIDDNIFRDIWLTTDVNQLLPPDADSPLYLPDDALLSRKALVEVSRQLRKKWRRPGSFRPGLRLPLGVTVTRVRPDAMLVSGVEVNNQRFYIPFEMRTRADGSATFYFDPNDYPSLVDPAMILMPWPADGTPFTVSDQQVEDALLTTSAFPAGFRRKRLQYCRQKVLASDEDSNATAAIAPADANTGELVCPDRYELTEAEFADGGLFDNLPIGLARLLAETSTLHTERPLPVQYIYLDPDRERYGTPVSNAERACEGENPPEACRELTYDLASEAVVLGGAIGTARNYELFRELTGENWRLNVYRLSHRLAEIMDAENSDLSCPAVLPYFERQLECSDRLRYTGRLLDFAHSYRITPIKAPFSARALLRERIATTCRPPSAEAEQDIVSECIIDTPRLRKQLTKVLVDLAAEVLPEKAILKEDIRRSALSIDSDRLIHVSSRVGPITGSLLGAFGAFLEYKFREFDYFVGIYDAILTIADFQCARNFPSHDQRAQFLTCRDRLSEELYVYLGLADHSKGRYVFALMARQEFGKEASLRFAYDPMPPEDRDMRIIYEGLRKSFPVADTGRDKVEELLPTESTFFEYLKAQSFKPTPPPGGGKSLLTLIMADPQYWSYELVNRATNRLVYLEKQAEAVFRAREPDPAKQDSANTALMGAGALVLRTANYKYPKFTFSPSTAPEPWFWRNIIPYEVAFDFLDADILAFWQPTWNFKHLNAGIRLGLGFTGGLFNSNADKNRQNYGTIGLDLTRNVKTGILSGWGVTPAVYHDWKQPAVGNQTSFGVDVHAYLLKNRLRISLGSRDVVSDADNTLFLTIGIADLPGLVYWLSR